LIEPGLAFPPTQYRLSGRQFYRSEDPTNSIKVLKEKRYKSKKKPRKSKQHEIQQCNKATHRGQGRSPSLNGGGAAAAVPATDSLWEVVYEKSIGTKMNDLDLCLEVVSLEVVRLESYQPLQHIRH